MTETVRTLIEASKTIEGEHKAYIGAYMNEKDGIQMVTAGADAETTFLLANIIIQTAIGLGLQPKYYWSTLRGAFKYMLRKLKGKEIGTVHMINARDLEKN